MTVNSICCTKFSFPPGKIIFIDFMKNANIRIVVASQVAFAIQQITRLSTAYGTCILVFVVFRDFLVNSITK